MSEQSLPLAESPSPRLLMAQIVVATLARFLLNTARRFPYIFAPALSRGLGVPVTAITSLVAVNQATGVLSPAFGPLSDRWGYRTMILGGLGMLAVGMLAGGLLPFYGMVLLALLLAGLGKSIFDPALQAYIGQHVPYHRRGLAIGVVEFAWAGSSLLGIPLIGLLIARRGWQLPFLLIGGLALLSIVVLGWLMPAGGRTASHAGRITFAKAWRLLRREPAVLGALGFGFWMSIANDSLFVVIGLWLESFGLSLTAVGLAASVIGAAELLGEIGVVSFADRVGLKRALLIGLTLTTLSYLLLPLLGLTVASALVSLFILFLFFEFSVVTSFSLFTEILPDARATMMATFLAAMSVGRVVGALLGGGLWQMGGLVAVTSVSALTTGLGLLCLLWGLRTWQR